MQSTGPPPLRTGGQSRACRSDAFPAARLIGVGMAGSVSHPQLTDGLDISQHLTGRFVALFPDLCLLCNW